MARIPEDLDLLRQIVNGLPEVIWMSDPAKKQMLFISPAYEAIWGRTPESLYASPRSWLEAIHPEDRDRVLQAALTKQVGGQYNEEYRIIRPDGSTRWIHDRAFPIRNESGEIYRIVGIAQDMTWRKRIETDLKESESRFSGVISIAADAIVMVDEAQRITLFNKGAERIFGYEASEVMGQPLDLLLPHRFADIHRQHVKAFGAGSESAKLMGGRLCEIIGRRKDGSEFPAEASISKWTRNGQTIYTAIVRDMTERKRAEEIIHRLAYYDHLTSLPNRALFQDLLKEAIFRGQADKKPVAILLMDLDHFKEINDTLGHHRGDFLIQQVGKQLSHVLRPSDTVARLGGDEFGVLLPLASPDDASLVAQKIMKGLEQPIEIEGLPIAVETSIGISLYPDHGESADSLIQRADVALYTAKKGGRGYMIYSQEQDQHTPRRLALLGELRQALEGRQLFLVYQPCVNLQTRRVTGVEALVRWQHPVLGLVPPDQFIVPAESTGLINPLALYVLKEALRQCLAWHQAGHKLKMAVNLSVRNLQDPHLPEQISEILRDHNLSATWLELEITESGIMDNIEIALTSIRLLNQKGIHFSIDDFGIGHSSFSYLKKLPVKNIKIDRSFVKNMLSDEGNLAIVCSIIDLTHNLQLHVIAEGVEDQETLEKLISLGCDAAQGYHIARPISAAELTHWLNESSWR
jgi:diguanylate cyclase (GGDEF)-like protein/PAS domain S-box-containing protein